MFYQSTHATPKPQRIPEFSGTKRIQYIFASFVFFHAVGATSWLFRGNPLDPVSGSPDTNLPARLIWGLLASLSIFFLARNAELEFRIIHRNWSLFAFVLLALCSSVWSISPISTLERATALSAGALIAYYLGVNFSIRELFALLLIILVISTVLSAVVALLFPGVGVTGGYSDAWKGIFAHKNTLGRVAALAIALTLFTIANTHAKRLAILLPPLALVLLRSESAGAIVLVAILVAILLLLLTIRRKPDIINVYVLLALPLGTALYLGYQASYDWLVSILGRDATLTNRTDIWKVALSFVEQRPFLGYGYSVFWESFPKMDSPFLFLYGFAPAHAHNGLLQLLLDLGMVGVTLFMISYFVSFHRAIMVMHSRAPQLDALWPIYCLCIIFAISLVEAPLSDHYGLYWILYVTISIQLSLDR